MGTYIGLPLGYANHNITERQQKFEYAKSELQKSMLCLLAPILELSEIIAGDPVKSLINHIIFTVCLSSRHLVVIMNYINVIILFTLSTFQIYAKCLIT